MEDYVKKWKIVQERLKILEKNNKIKMFKQSFDRGYKMD